MLIHDVKLIEFNYSIFDINRYDNRRFVHPRQSMAHFTADDDFSLSSVKGYLIGRLILPKDVVT